MTSVVVHQGYAYGLSDGLLECVDLQLAERCWKVRGHGHGHVLLVDDLLLVQTEENGEIVLVETDPEQYHEIARMDVLSSHTWNYPVVAGSYLVMRNSQRIACCELALLPEISPVEDGLPSQSANP